MNRTEPHLVYGDERTHSNLKRVSRTPKDNYVTPPRSDLFHDCHEELTSTPNTPSMTTDSTRSTTSSIIACDSCGNPSHYCQCSNRSQSDLDSIQFHNSETESIPASPDLVSLQRKDAFRPQRTFLQYVVDAHIANSTPRARKSFSPLASTSERFSQDEQQSQEVPLRLRDANRSLERVSTPNNAQHLTANPVFDDSGSEMTDEDRSTDEEDDSNDWGGPEASLEAIVLDAMGGDDVLAAQLIPVLHKAFQSELAQKVTPWRSAITERPLSTHGTAPGQSHSSGPSPGQLPANPRKRQRRQGSDQEPDDDDDDDTEGEDRKNSRELEDGFDGSSPVPSPRLACPFFKRNPSKYGVQHGTSESSKGTDYRICAGPGFKNIQRLKEHLKRKHYPVQCDRCYKIFLGSDRSSCVLALESHRQLPNPCQRLDSALKEGISDAQWAKLDKKRSPKKIQPSRIEKYWEIWDTIFPGQERPKTPWYDGTVHSNPVSEESRCFSEMFGRMLSFQVNDQQIRFADGLEDQMMTRLQLLAQKAFSTYVSLHGLPSSTHSGSTRSRPQSSSLLGGSYGMISSTSRTRGQHSSSTSLSTAATRSRAYSMDMQTSPTGQTMMADTRNQGSMPPPPFIGVTPMVQQNFVNNPLGVTIQTQQQQIGYNPTVADTMSSYDNGNYTYTPGNTWDMDFDAGASNIGGPAGTNLNAGNFASHPRSSMSQNGVSHADQTHDLTALGWPTQMQDSQQRHYGGQQP